MGLMGGMRRSDPPRPAGTPPRRGLFQSSPKGYKTHIRVQIYPYFLGKEQPSQLFPLRIANQNPLLGGVPIGRGGSDLRLLSINPRSP
jgi:hypothetical protein